MNLTYYLPILMLLLIIFIDRQNRAYLAKKFIKNRLRKDKKYMVELAKRFIDKECIIYTFNSNQIAGTIKEVSDGSLLVDNKGTLEVINLDFVVRIREYPKNKNGKKKSVVID